ncbi:hypothetical protein ATEIFO6365_0004078900 [Aspergillus terreus]|uniref:Uncharacterized protein n=1 Tax=Aspergillus terreus TaxID=33178 RepID=A0A5M3YRM5_ASPTE|nr:hypothetical protein HFD88_009619 [Aspergillus terreus]GES58638.1 hypothetical protein ATETN484_0002081400 [Aspergillus terreus]GFF15670.1 hypothetical protein ATEIFO6365_0004078900 [Aspergillus terreus]
MPGSLSANDLRCAGTAAKRAHDKKAKWISGGRPAPGCRMENAPMTRPIIRTIPARYHRRLQFDRKGRTNQLSTDAKINLSYDVREALDSASDSSSGETLDEPSAAQEVVAEMTPNHSVEAYDVSGQTVLSQAINKAVERFETRETEKLVREYEIVTPESESAMGYLADDDDFELVDHGRL